MNWLDCLIIFLCCIIEVFLIYDFFSNFFDMKIDVKKFKMIFVVTICAEFLINIMQNNLLNLIIIPIVLWVFVSVVFDALLGSRIVYFAIAYIVMIGVEFLYYILTNMTSAFFVESGIIPVSEFLWQLMLIKFLNYIVFVILKQISFKSKNRMANRLFLIYLCVPISALGIMLTVFYSGIDFRNNIVLKIVMTLFFIFMIVGTMLLFYAFQKHSDRLNENIRQQLELVYQKAEVDRLSKIAELNDDYYETIHNISHYLKVIDEYAYERKYDEICKVTEKINGKLIRKEEYEYCNHRLLNVILSEYSVQARNNGVVFDVYIEPGCVLDHIADVDLITMLGNILDNSIYAASKKGEDSIVSVRIFMQREGKLCVIKVVNDFDGEIKKSKGKLISTKKESGIHGVGLASVAKLAEKNNGYFEHYIEDDRFNSIIVLSL